MELSEYVAKCSTFATFTNADALYLYLKLGLIEEVGEVSGKFAKFVRRIDDADFTQLTEDDKKDIAKELGDVCWFTAMLLKLAGSPVRCDRSFQDYIDVDEKDLKPVLQVVQSMTKNSCRSELACLEMFSNVAILGSIIGYSLDDIMQMNIDKLTDRKKRGVIKGNGDNR